MLRVSECKHCLELGHVLVDVAARLESAAAARRLSAAKRLAQKIGKTGIMAQLNRADLAVTQLNFLRDLPVAERPIDIVEVSLNAIERPADGVVEA